MKICTKCKIEKDFSCFGPRKNSKTIFQSWCKECYAKHNNTRYHQDDDMKKRIRKQAFESVKKCHLHVKNFLSKQSCIVCGEKDPLVLDFDHRDQSQKICGISQYVRKGVSIENLEKEMAKCDILCANCHRRKTIKQLGWNSKFYT